MNEETIDKQLTYYEETIKKIKDVKP